MFCSGSERFNSTAHGHTGLRDAWLPHVDAHEERLALTQPVVLEDVPTRGGAKPYQVGLSLAQGDTEAEDRKPHRSRDAGITHLNASVYATDVDHFVASSNICFKAASFRISRSRRRYSTSAAARAARRDISAQSAHPSEKPKISKAAFSHMARTIRQGEAMRKETGNGQ